MTTISAQAPDIQDIFKTQLKIEAKVMAIETLFVNERRTRKTDYKPSYQRNYVWDDDKATYFIESILLGTEIPPLIFFNSGEKIEVIDGRQRYETIKRFIDKDFKLKKKGLLKLKDLGNKNFDDLGELKDIFWDTKLRTIEFSFRDQSLSSTEKEDIVKKEIFKRYNSGITPLKSVDIDKAKYQENTVNSYFKSRLGKNKNIQKDLTDIFFAETPFDLEKVLKRIRQQLVLPYIPIRYYAGTGTKQGTIERFFEYISDITDDEEGLYIKFTEKVSLLKELKEFFSKHGLQTNRLVFECLFWAFSILEKEEINIDVFSEEKTKLKIYNFYKENIESYKIEDNNFYKITNERYEKTSQLFKEITNLNFDLYLMTHSNFKEKNKQLSQVVTDNTFLSKFESLRLNKPDASSNAIDDICARMVKERFLLRPSYQRKEVIDRFKSSAIIESILLGIKLPPIFLYKRNNGIAEVIDGQQRLLSILGYLGKSFLNEDKRLVTSDKNKFSLRRLNILKKDIEGKKFEELPTAYQDRILDFDLWVIEISEKNNPDFDPIDLFIRLNYKPFPIMENTFEMWNSYIDREIIKKVKEIYKKYESWFYVRRDNRRMENEGLLTYLSFLEFSKKSINGRQEAPQNLEIYRTSKINIRIQAKSEITRVLDNFNDKRVFLESCDSLENNFILKVKALVSNKDTDTDDDLKTELDNVLGTKRVRTFQNFYTLWLMLLNLPIESIIKNKLEIRTSLNKLIREMKGSIDVKTFNDQIKSLETKFM